MEFGTILIGLAGRRPDRRSAPATVHPLPAVDRL